MRFGVRINGISFLYCIRNIIVTYIININDIQIKIRDRHREFVYEQY